MMDPRDDLQASTLRLWLWRWHALYNATILAAAAVVVSQWAPHALPFVALVPLLFVPFSWARHWFDLAVARHFPALPGHLLLIAAGIVADVILAAQFLTGRSVESVPWLHGSTVAWIGPVWFSTFSLLAAGLSFGRIGARLLRRLGRLLANRRRVPSTESPGIDLGRRRFLQQAGVLGAGTPFVASVSGAGLTYDFRVEEYDIDLPHWPRGLDGLRVAHLSDIHVGGAMDRARLLRVAALTNRAQPDLVVHTGDFLTHRDGEFDLPLYEALGRIRAPHGQWACLGNHDFDDVNRLVRKLREAGVQTLRNRIATLFIDGHPLEIAGLDYAFGRTQWREIYAQIHQAWGPRRAVPRILLNHDPMAFAALPDDCADLVCSGHTHGGQIGIQLGPQRAVTVVGLAGIPDQGVFPRGDMRLFVTRCVGFYGYPMRIGIPPEIAILTIRRSRRSTIV